MAGRLKIAAINENVRYEPDDRCPLHLAISVAVQGVMIPLTNTVLYVTVIVLAADRGGDYVSWAVFSALAISGVLTLLQASRLGRFGAGHMALTGSGPHFLAISVLTLTRADVPTLASLIAVSSLVQFALAQWLPLLRRIITPTVSGTALMLIAVTVMSIAVRRVGDIPEGALPVSGPAAAAATLAVGVMLAMRGSGIWRLWAVLIGIASGCAVAALFGLYDLQRLFDAPWVYAPDAAGWPGLDLRPGAEFWTLLPAFLIVNLVVAVKTSGDGVVIQRISRARPQATDFRIVQATVNTNGLGTLLCGLAGTLPPLIYIPSVAALVNLTGVASRNVGYIIGGILLALALFPKAAALLLITPSPVMGAFLMITMGLLFVEGIRMVSSDGLNPMKGLIVGISLSIGVGLENQNVLAELLGPVWGALLGNGLTVGIAAAILMTVFIELTNPRPRRLETTLDMASLPGIDEFLGELASRIGWNDASTGRLRAVGEETLLCLLQSGKDYGAGSAPRLVIVARPGASAELEYMAVFDEENIEDQLTYLSEEDQMPEEHEASFRLLRHYASSVSHRKYHGIDIVTVRVEGSR